VRDEVARGASLAGEGEGEHGDARQLIGRIRRSSDREHVRELMNELEQIVQRHLEEDERETLPQARRTLGEARLLEVGDEFEAAKTRWQG
jgi:hemerythrin-like domain-containing protein